MNAVTDLAHVVELLGSTGNHPRVLPYSEGEIILLHPSDNPVIQIPEGHSIQFTFDKQGKMIGMVLYSDYHWRLLSEQQPDSHVDILVLENANRDYVRFPVW